MNIPEKLIRNLQNDNIVLFIGAGMSQEVGYPNWKDLTIEILNGLSPKDKKFEGYIEALNKDLFDPLEILNKIEFHKNDVVEILENVLKKYSGINPSKNHRKLFSLSTKLITTNYDELLEKASNGIEKVVYHSDYKVAKLSEYDKFIFKIHGDINEPDKCILFPSQYNNLYSTEEKSPIFEFKKIISDKSILFIGFGYKDPYVSRIFDFINKLYKGYTKEHFIITTEATENYPPNIHPIIIQNYSELHTLLNLLIKEKTNTKKKTISDYQSTKDNDGILESKSNDYDNPPEVKHWVGRKMELQNIDNENFKIVFITGIGGQGKSALASHYLKEIFNPEIYEFGDWRDFKEETNRFQSKLISIIRRLNENVKPEQFDNINNEDLVELFFIHLENRKIVFVFDNIDSYIDLEKFVPKAGIGLLFNEALKRNHKSKFIFTCRPFIREASVNFYQISLAGLALDETIELFEKYNLPLKKVEIHTIAEKVHKLTKGHPLWINLIAAQTLNGIEVIEAFIDTLEKGTNFDEDNFSSILSHKILDKVWSLLNDKQRGLLRGIAETVKPESIDDLQLILKSEFNHNQFSKAIKNLKNLHLIEQKSSTYGVEQVELHPLVRDYIITKFPRSERLKYLTFFVKYYDNFIYILKPKLNSQLSFAAFQNWTSKIELEINIGDYKTALIVLEEISIPILAANYTDEYLRVAEKLFENIDWKSAIDNEYPYFHTEFDQLVVSLIQAGRYNTAEDYLLNYSKLIDGKSSNYLRYCSIKCYLYWFQDKYKEAIKIGEEGEFLLSSSRLSDSFKLSHNLSLARRDSRNTDQVTKALNYFIMDQSIEILLSSDIDTLEYQGHYYGNVGRCLEFLGQLDNALKLYCRSYRTLAGESHSNTQLNKGFACQWIAEVFSQQNEVRNALLFIRFGIIIWEQFPIKCNKLKAMFSKYVCDTETKKQIQNKADWEIEKECLKIIDSLVQ